MSLRDFQPLKFRDYYNPDSHITLIYPYLKTIALNLLPHVLIEHCNKIAINPENYRDPVLAMYLGM